MLVSARKLVEIKMEANTQAVQGESLGGSPLISSANFVQRIILYLYTSRSVLSITWDTEDKKGLFNNDSLRQLSFMVLCKNPFLLSVPSLFAATLIEHWQVKGVLRDNQEITLPQRYLKEIQETNKSTVQYIPIIALIEVMHKEHKECV